jgi:hypothetical protein
MLGGSLDVFTDDTPAWLPGAGVEWALSDEHTLFLTYTEAVRQPSYTELNYESPSSLGNAGLERQETRTTELGWKGSADIFTWKTTLFYEEGQNIVDWIRRAPGARWTSVNLDEVRTWGATAEGRATLTADTDLGLDLLALDKSCDTDFYASRYALDYRTPRPAPPCGTASPATCSSACAKASRNMRATPSASTTTAAQHLCGAAVAPPPPLGIHAQRGRGQPAGRRFPGLPGPGIRRPPLLRLPRLPGERAASKNRLNKRDA